MKSREEFREQILLQWAEYFGCTVDELSEPVDMVVPKEQEDDKGFHIWQIGKRAFIETDPAYADIISTVVQCLPKNERFGEAAVRQLIADGAIADATIEDVTVGMVHFLYPDDLPPAIIASGYEIRQMNADDKALQEPLSAACTPEEVDEGWVNVADDVAFGALYKGQLAALASAYPWRGGSLDVGVLTHPKHRRHALGKAVVREVCAWGLEQGYPVVYRNNTTNHGSHGIAKGLGFEQYFSQISIWLKAIT